jgi:periplasmic copper chaperone A
VKIVAFAAFLLLASCSKAGTDPDISLSDAWVRATVAGQSSSAAYFTIANAGGDDRLLSVESPVAKASLHSVTHDGAVVRMRAMDSLDIAGGSTVSLKPGSDHVMLSGLAALLSPGETVPIILKFEKSGERAIDADVRGSTGAGK